jgi:hypothetical protein
MVSIETNNTAMASKTAVTKTPTLQIHCTENSKKIFPEKVLCRLSPNFHIHVSVSDLYIPTIAVFLFCYRKICGPILAICKSLPDS